MRKREKIPGNALSELFNKMKSNPDLAGSFVLLPDEIEWRVFDKYIVSIGNEYIGIDKIIFGRFKDSLTHWHPDEEDIYIDICRLGTKGNVTVIHKSILGESVLYSGPATDCKYKSQWLFGRYIYLYAK